MHNIVYQICPTLHTRSLISLIPFVVLPDPIQFYYLGQVCALPLFICYLSVISHFTRLKKIVSKEFQWLWSIIQLTRFI